MVTSCSQNREVWFGDNGKQLSVPKNKTEKNVSVAGLIFFYLFVYSLPVCLRDSPPWSTAKWRVLNTHAHPKWHSSHGEPGGAINHCSVWSWRKTLIFLFPTFPGLYDTFWSKLLYFCFSFLLKKKEQRMMSYWHYMQIQPSCQYSSIFTAFTHTYDSFPKPG